MHTTSPDNPGVLVLLARYANDTTRPSPSQALRDLLVRAVLPAVVCWAVIVGIGALLKGPFAGLSRSEESVNRTLAADRTSTWNDITAVWSHIGNTEIVIGVCVVAVALLWWRSRQWWYAVIPAIAIALQASTFVLATLVIGRPRPQVAHLDPAPPTSSYPSGHVGASTALYLTFAFMASRIENAVLRRVVIAVCVAIPLMVTYARLYRGMHHVTDVTVGMANGVVCALLAWRYLRRDDADQTRA